MKKIFSAAIGLLVPVSFAVAAIERSDYSGRTFADLVDMLVSFVNPLAALLVSLTVLIFLINLARYVWTAGDSKHHEEALSYIGWSLLALLVMFGLWGFVNLVTFTLFGN